MQNTNNDHIAYPSVPSDQGPYEKKSLLARQQPTAPLLQANEQGANSQIPMAPSRPSKMLLCGSLFGFCCTLICLILALLLLIKMGIISLVEVGVLSNQVQDWSPANHCVVKSQVITTSSCYDGQAYFVCNNVTFTVSFVPVFTNNKTKGTEQTGTWRPLINASNSTMNAWLKHKYVELEQPYVECWYQLVNGTYTVNMYPFGSQIGMLAMLGIIGLVMGCCCLCYTACTCCCSVKGLFTYRKQAYQMI